MKVGQHWLWLKIKQCSTFIPTQREACNHVSLVKGVGIWPETCHLLATCSFTSLQDSHDPRCSIGPTPPCECGKDESASFGCSLPVITKNGWKLLWASRELRTTFDLEKRVVIMVETKSTVFFFFLSSNNSNSNNSKNVQRVRYAFAHTWSTLSWTWTDLSPVCAVFTVSLCP